MSWLIIIELSVVCGTSKGSDQPAHMRSLISSVVLMINYNRKSFIYMQPINDRMEFQGIDYNRKNPQVKEFHFYLTPNANFCSILVIK